MSAKLNFLIETLQDSQAAIDAAKRRYEEKKAQVIEVLQNEGWVEVKVDPMQDYEGLIGGGHFLHEPAEGALSFDNWLSNQDMPLSPHLEVDDYMDYVEGQGIQIFDVEAF